MPRDVLLVERFLAALELAPGITVADASAVLLCVRVDGERVVRVAVDESALAANVRRVAADTHLAGLAGADPTSRSFTLFLLELQSALQAPSADGAHWFRYTERGMVPGQPRSGMLPA